MSDREEKFIHTVFEAWEHMTDKQKEKCLDFFDRLVVKGEKFTKEEIIRMAQEEA